MRKAVDHTGKRYGKLTAVCPVGGKNRQIVWQCLCDCGKIVNIISVCLTNGHTKSCGCLRKEIKTTHGLSGGRGKPTRLYKTWTAMRYRCNKPKNAYYSNYGGRGIKVCEEWNNDYKNFHDWATANGYKEGLSIDRINNDGNYEPDNCRWATPAEQALNKRTNRLLTFNGETKTTIEWAEKIKINENTLRKRLFKGWPVERVLTEPVNELQRRRNL
ncbi:hypothetical protein DK28_0206485 [Peptococcaceae bacterium SCADC1_2_3]|jgi:hypothetical protein|nr:hypothetical protein DK28_0206485 [Peptococcaceae bacterium SCADC1_2_3]KFI34346.1 hypothetical protein HY00_03305 [Peptococcaceae bacterium SCADC1_2_3]